MSKLVWGREDSPHCQWKVFNGTDPAVSIEFMVILLRVPDRVAVFKDNMARLPRLRSLSAVDASNEAHFWKAFNEQQIRFVDTMLFDSLSLGPTALHLSRIKALRWQVDHNVSWLVMMEDDVAVRPGFTKQIETLASSLEASGSTANIARLGIWGELYLVPLAGAKAILCRYCQSGMLLGSDNQLRMLSGPECASPPADFPPPIGSPYKLRAQPGAGHNHDRDVTRRAARLGGVGNHTVWLGTISRQFQERARVEMKRFPAQPRWCRRLGSSCRFGVPLDNISQRLYDGWRVGTCEQHTRQRHPEHFSCSEEAKGLTSPPAASATPALWAPFAPRWAASRHGARALSVSRVAPSSGAERPAAAPGARLGEYLWRFLLPFMELLPGEVRRGEE